MSEHALYRFFDAKDRLLYVGITGEPRRRFSGHRGDKPWWRDVTTIRIERFDTRRALATAEMQAIASEHPKYNKVYAAGQHQTTKVPPRTVVSPGSEANTFGTVQREGPPIRDPEELGVPQQYPCSECMGFVVKFGDHVQCAMLNCSWRMSFDDYERLNEPWRFP